MRVFVVRYAGIASQAFVVLLDDDARVLSGVLAAGEKMFGARRQAASVREVKQDKLADLVALFSPSQNLVVAGLDEDELCGPGWLVQDLTTG